MVNQPDDPQPYARLVTCPRCMGRGTILVRKSEGILYVFGIGGAGGEHEEQCPQCGGHGKIEAIAYSHKTVLAAPYGQPNTFSAVPYYRTAGPVLAITTHEPEPQPQPQPQSESESESELKLETSVD